MAKCKSILYAIKAFLGYYEHELKQINHYKSNTIFKKPLV